MSKSSLDLGMSLSLYAMLFVAYYGWGRGLAAALRLQLPQSHSPFTMVWLGWAAHLLVLQFLHFFVPIDYRVSAVCFGAGWALAMPAIYRMNWQLRTRLDVNAVCCILTISCFAIWVAGVAMLPAMNFDTGLYHLNNIRWLNSHPIVPGLGNLHGRLAFNQSFFVYASSLNFFPYFPYGRSVANSFLFLLVFAEVAWHLFGLLRSGQRLITLDPLAYLGHVFLLPVIFHLAITSGATAEVNGLASPTPDFASALLQIQLFLRLVQGLAISKNSTDRDDWGIVVAILAATAVTIKLSNLVSGLCAALIALYHARAWSFFVPGGRKSLARFVTVPVLILAVWAGRGYVLSGYPAYPSTLLGIGADWTVPEFYTQREANLVYSTARAPGIEHTEVLGNWRWVGPWWHRIHHERKGDVRVLLVAGMALSVLVSTYLVRLTVYQQKSAPNLANGVLVLPAGAGLVFWFFTAPDPRFAIGLSALFAVGAALMLLSYCHHHMNARCFILATIILYLLVNVALGSLWFSACSLALLFLSHYRPQTKAHWWTATACIVFLLLNVAQVHRCALKCPPSTTGYQSCVTVRMIPRELPAVTIYTPEEGYQCWDSAIPSTPYPHSGLRLRRTGELESGFHARPPEVAMPTATSSAANQN